MNRRFPEPPRFTDPGRVAGLGSAWEEVDACFAAFRERYRVPGVSYGVVVDGSLAHSGGIGFADLDVARPAGADSVFRIASMTKSVTALCVVSLRDEGLLALDDPVARHVPELDGLVLPTADAAPLTVRQLLCMSAGLVVDDPWADRQLDMEQETFSALLTAGVLFDLSPGTAFEYSNLGYAILGRVVENVAGASLPEVSQRRVFDPLAMTATTWHVERIPADVAAHGYRREGAGWVRETPLRHGAFAAMGGLATSVTDFSRYVAFHLAAWPPRDDPDPGPVARASVREMAQAWRAGPTYYSAHGAPGIRSDGYGYGLVSAVHERDGNLVAHSGGLPGFGSHVEWLPDHGVGIVGFANLTYAPVHRVVREAFDVLAATGQLLPRSPAPSAALLAAQDAVMRLYASWDDDLATEVAAASLFCDLPAARRREAMEQLRATYGPCTRTDQLVPDGALRGRWRMVCAAGIIHAGISLTPTPPPRIQTLDLKPVGPEPTGLR